MSTTEPREPLPLHCTCGCCVAAWNAVHDAIISLMQNDCKISNVLMGATRSIADSAAIACKPGHEHLLRDRLAALFIARFDATILKSAEIEARQQDHLA